MERQTHQPETPPLHKKALIFRIKPTPCTNLHFFTHHRTRRTTEMKQHNQNTKKEIIFHMILSNPI